MKLPNFDIEQKVLLSIAIMIAFALVITGENLNQYTPYLFVVLIISFGSFCYVAHKKKWINDKPFLGGASK